MRSDLEKMKDELSRFRLELIGELAVMSAEIDALQRALLQKELIGEEEMEGLRSSSASRKDRFQKALAERVGPPF